MPSYLQPIDRPAGSSATVIPWEMSPEYISMQHALNANPRYVDVISATTPGFASIYSSGAFNMYATGSAIENLGLMGVESGQLNFAVTKGNLSLLLWGGVTKYGFYRGLTTSYGFGAEAKWRISPRWSLTVFGQYYTPAAPLTNAMAGYFNTTHFGGYASYDISDHWGISLGAQAYRSMVTNNWEAQPIVMPYYKINKNVSIGADVGGILYNVARDMIDHQNNRHSSSGTIAPPVGGPPPVAPRR